MSTSCSPSAPSRLLAAGRNVHTHVTMLKVLLLMAWAYVTLPSCKLHTYLSLASQKCICKTS
eukprot:6199134-Pleurochrysis_carterae.AAC.1